MAFRSFTILSLIVSVVLAQSPDPYIPSAISSNCSTYLTSLDSNSGFTSCTSPFTSALAPFAPGANTPSLSAISSALSQLCTATAFSACPQSMVTTQLSAFQAACQAELTTSPNVQVQTIYDVLYSLVPIREVICSKDDNGNYCATELSNSSKTASPQEQTLLSNYLYNPLPNSGSSAALVPNATTYQSTNLLFMFLQPSLSSAELCTTCTRNAITPFITFESNSPYAVGMSQSLLLAGQVSLYSNISSKCGAGFLSGAVQAAGGLSGGLLSGALPRFTGQELSAAVSAILGVGALVAASL